MHAYSSTFEPTGTSVPVVYLTGDATASLFEMESADGAGGYGAPNVMLLRNESSTDMSLVAMLASCSPVALQVQHTAGGLEDACGPKRAYLPTFEASGEDPGEDDIGDDCTQKKRRLSLEQVRSLEKNFEVENKLEPERKMQLARELGLQPRQVAVWFQNRRARWKTKQLERDYEVLTSDYNRLKTDYDTVLQEKLDLQVEIDCLTGKIPAAKQNTVPEKGKRQKTEVQVAVQKTSEGSVKLQSVPSKVNASIEELAVRKEEGSRVTFSSDSISSEIVNSDSPRTMDSGSLVPLENIGTFPQFSGGMVDSNIIPFPDNLCDQMPSPLDCPRISVKPEDSLYQDDNCNFILPQLDDVKVVPWWEWA